MMSPCKKLDNSFVRAAEWSGGPRGQRNLIYREAFQFTSRPEYFQKNSFFDPRGLKDPGQSARPPPSRWSCRSWQGLEDSFVRRRPDDLFLKAERFIREKSWMRISWGKLHESVVLEAQGIYWERSLPMHLREIDRESDRDRGIEIERERGKERGIERERERERKREKEREREHTHANSQTHSDSATHNLFLFDMLSSHDVYRLPDVCFDTCPRAVGHNTMPDIHAHTIRT